MNRSFWINDQEVSFSLEGEAITGNDEVMLVEDDDLTKDTSWHTEGFTISHFLPLPLYQVLQSGISSIIKTEVETLVGKEIPDFRMESYHRFVDDSIHASLITRIRKCFPIAQLPIDRIKIENRIGEICGLAVSAYNPGEDIAEFCIRIVRPNQKADNNPPHRDVYLDHLRNGINIYVPLAGSDENSSLPLMPQSHLMNENLIERTTSGSKVNGIPFTVPCITRADGEVRMIRPNPNYNEVLVFSPYLVHGGGKNFNSDKTRVSLEMRFFRNRK